ncbi:MAG: hypothetical protein SPD11_12585 [Sphaerochaetaceae bacterium]|nr:hypothetical protein [Sphaerochaetaceae bacterium]
MSSPDEIIADTRHRNSKETTRDNLIFIKKQSRLMEVVSLEQAGNGRLLFHKTAFRTKNNPYPSLPRVGALSDAGGVSTIDTTAETVFSGSLSGTSDKGNISRLLDGVNAESVSRVVDENGEPKIMYHGSPRAGFHTFEIERSGSSNTNAPIGFWFAEDRALADSFSRMWWGRNPGVHEVFLDMKNPKEYITKDMSGEASRLKGEIDHIQTQKNAILKELTGKEPDNSFVQTGESRLYKEAMNDNLYFGKPFGEKLKQWDALEARQKQLYEQLNVAENGDAYLQMLDDLDEFATYNGKKHKWGRKHRAQDDSQKAIAQYKRSLTDQGYDGIVIRNTDADARSVGRESVNQYVVFDSTQIKSATDNRGTFDAENPNILYQLAPETVRQLDYPIALPDSDVFREAVENTKGATITDDGLLNSGVSRERAASGALFQADDAALSQVRREYADTETRLRANPDNFDADGNHLAPNGKPSNLTYEQWVQVRTPAFKKWFGNWEGREAVNRIVDSRPFAINVSAIPASPDLKAVKTSAANFGKTLTGTYTNLSDGFSFNLTTSSKFGSLKEILEHDYKDVHHLQSIAAIPYIAENSQFVTELKNDNPRKPEIDRFRYYVSAISIDGFEYMVKSVVSIAKDGNRYYDHKLTELAKIKEFISSSVNQKQTDLEINSSCIKDKRLLQIIQEIFTSSKVVDENGEPQVVYHGTTNRDEASTWNPKWKSYGTEYSRFSVFRRKNEGRANSGFFFNSDMDNAGGYGFELYACYLNLRNPLDIEANGQNYGSMEFNAMKKDICEWAEYAEKKGYDGVIFNDVSDGVGLGDLDVPANDFVAFKANQVKSAMDDRWR